MKTLFEKIVSRELTAEIVYEDDYTIAINDKNAQAPVHVLVIPKKVFSSLEDVDEETLFHCINTVRKVASQMKIKDSGYRVLTNIGKNGGQSVPHLHFHVLGGKRITSVIA